jgi:hypothetical protein
MSKITGLFLEGLADCYFDGQTGPNILPVHWKSGDIKKFRRMCRKHNQLVGFGFDPEARS